LSVRLGMTHLVTDNSSLAGHSASLAFHHHALVCASSETLWLTSLSVVVGPARLESAGLSRHGRKDDAQFQRIPCCLLLFLGQTQPSVDDNQSSRSNNAAGPNSTTKRNATLSRQAMSQSPKNSVSVGT
jgi:hypothetical protein